MYKNVKAKKHITILFLFGWMCFGFSQSFDHKETINELWKFHKGILSNQAIDDTSTVWQNANLPHTWNALDILDDEKGYYRGEGWYKKELTVPQLFKEQKVFLYFEGANQKTTLYVNGKVVGATHIGGYNPFTYNISEFIRKGSNEILIKVDNTHDDTVIPLAGDFSHFGGIYRDVYLMIKRPIHFDLERLGANGVQVSTSTVSVAAGTLSITAHIKGDNKQKHFLKNILLDNNRDIVKEVSTVILAESVTKSTFTIDKPTLWSPETPNLYQLITQIIDKKGQVLDQVENPVGFRWFQFDSKKGFYINGKQTKLIGTNRHQDFWRKGNAVNDELHRKDMELLKEMGINFLRISHYPQDPAILEMCDRYGFVTTLEIPFVNRAAKGETGKNNSIKMLREAIRSNYNHPSIVAWGTGNETTSKVPSSFGEDYVENFKKTHKELIEVVKEEDSTRYPYCVFFKKPAYHDKLGIRFSELVGYNKYTGWYRNEITAIDSIITNLVKSSLALNPEKPFILSEYGGGADPRIRSFKPSRFDFSMEYQFLLHKEYLRVIQKTPEIVGANVWNYADFQVEHRKDAMPHINNKGLVTVDRRKKDAYYFYKAALSKKPFIGIASKLWTERAGIADTQNATTCTQGLTIVGNTKEVALTLNGKSLGKKTFDFFNTQFNVPFQHGKNLLELTSKTEDGKELKDFLVVNFKVHPYDLKSKTKPFEEIAINVGSDCYFIEDHNMKYLWMPDQPYRKGSYGYIGGIYHRNHKIGKETIGSEVSILGTLDDPVYQTQLIGIDHYKFDVPDGNYELTLYLAEVDTKEENNEMDIFVNDNKIWSALNLKKAYEKNYGVSKRFLTTANDNTGITISFKALQGKTRISGIKLRKVY